MKTKIWRRIFGMLLALTLVIGLIPMGALEAHAAHRCPDCEDLIDGSPYCSECYKCDACVELCIECGVCTDCSGSEICDSCSTEETGDNMCLECAYEKGTHCSGCDQCYFVVQGWCEECGLCADCVEIDEECSSAHGMVVCVECAADKGTHCPGCDTCYFDAPGWCEECGLCGDCVEIDIECSSVHGAVLCEECAADLGSHCPDCGQCYFDVQQWCEECMLCADCVEIDEGCSGEVGAIICKECAVDHGHHCPNCDQCYFEAQQWCEECGQCVDCCPACNYCCEEAGEIICVECAIDSGMHCPDCSECYGECGGEFCAECGICANCAEINPNEDLCLDCAIAAGLHCPGCESYIADVPLCENCGECCLDCADSFCENCNLCSECVLMCQDCGSCEECATICPNCEEYCSECVGLCDDCDLCLVCCEDIANFAGCDCGEWVCVENMDWDEHFAEEHSNAQPGQTGHSVRPAPTWDWDSTYHWHRCVYCYEDAHLTGKGTHTFDANGICTVCRYVRNAQIQIIVQPSDSKAAFVTSPDEDYDDSNIARFSVKASGKSELTYTWYEGYYHYGLGKMVYTPLTDPEQGEDFEGSEIYWLVPTDACNRDWYIRCVITDIYGNEVTTRDALVQAKHNYQYFKYYQSNQYPLEYAESNKYGHILQCVADDCGQVTHLRPHEDEDRNGYCDICRFEIGKILITKQPKNSVTAFSYNPDEGYDDTNFAYFSVTAEGESKLTYTWCRKQYVGGVLKYVPLTNPGQNEIYDGPELKLLVPEDACCQEYTYACVITDEEGNETRTVDVTLKAKHNYQYYEDYLTTRSDPYADARKKYHGHMLVCVSPECGKVTRLRQHVDENKDYICEVCSLQKDMNEDVGIYVTAPKEGAYPSYTITYDHPLCYTAVGNYSNYKQYRRWYVSDNGVSNWKLLDSTTPFVAGKYYKIAVDMTTKTGYEFWPLVSYDGCEPYTWATVNGNYTKAHATEGKDPAHYITIYYEFGMCNDSVVEDVTIVNITEPIAGEKPAYTAAIRGNGYKINTAKNSYYDAYWVNEKWYYIKNGIGWFDLTESDWVYENEYFIPGHEYLVYAYLITEEGYEFAYTSKYYENATIGSINSFVADVEIWEGYFSSQRRVKCSFTCQGKKITTVMVNGLETPKAGETPDYTATTAYPEWYQLDPIYAGTNGIVWFDEDGYQMDPSDTFEAGKKYRVELKVISATLDGANTSQFVLPVSAYINGVQVVENGDWDAVYANTNAVYINYTFPKPAMGADVSGTITSIGDEDDPITIRLKKDGTDKVIRETTVTGNCASYYIGNVASGTYQIEFVKNDHITQQDTITISSTNIVHNVQLSCAHNPVGGWTSDSTYHWNACGNNGCLEKLNKAQHTQKTTTTKATLTSNGSIVKKCSVCGNVASSTVIARPTTFTLSTVDYTCNGQAKKPAVTVKDANGKTLVNGTDYTVTYPSGRVNPGTYTVTVTMKGNYSGTKTLNFNIKLATPTVKATNAVDGVKVTWNAVAGAANYKVYKSVYTSSGWSGWTAIKTGYTGTSYTDTTVKSGHNVRYTVRAFNGSNSSTFKASNSIKFLATPTVKASNAVDGVKLTWNAVGSAKSYIVYKSTYTNGAWSSWTRLKTGVTGTSYTDTTVKSADNVRYTVKAINGNFTSYIKASNSIKFLATPTVKATNAAKGISITWNKITGAKSYIVYKSIYSGGKWSSWARVATGVTGTSYTDATVKSGDNVRYTVKAINGNFTGYIKASNSIKFLATPTVKVAKTTTGIKASWNAVGSAKGYIVYRRTYSGGKWGSWTAIKTTTATSYTDTTAKTGVTYQYTVRAYNGNFKGWFVGSVSIKR